MCDVDQSIAICKIQLKSINVLHILFGVWKSKHSITLIITLPVYHLNTYNLYNLTS